MVRIRTIVKPAKEGKHVTVAEARSAFRALKVQKKASKKWSRHRSAKAK